MYAHNRPMQVNRIENYRTVFQTINSIVELKFYKDKFQVVQNHTSPNKSPPKFVSECNLDGEALLRQPTEGVGILHSWESVVTTNKAIIYKRFCSGS